MNAGCLGPNDDSLCGTCVTIATLDTCAAGAPTAGSVPSPAGSGSNTGVIVGVVIVVVVVLIAVVALIIVLIIFLRKRCQCGQSGSFDINVREPN